MGKNNKRHFKGNNKSYDKKRRLEKQQEWQNNKQNNRNEYVTKIGNNK